MTQSLDVLGVLETESTRIVPQVVRQSCYRGIRVTDIDTTCKMQRTKAQGEGFVYDATSAYNDGPDGESSEICLQCCNNVRVGVGEPVDEVWDLECEVLNENVLASLRAQWYGYEFRFARNKDPDDTGVVRCAMGRIGCAYEDTDGAVLKDGRNLTCTSKEADGDYGSCDNTSCTCEIPGSQREGQTDDYNDAVRQRRYDDVVDGTSCTRARSAANENGAWYLKGYTLTLEVQERATNDGAQYWRTVTDCHVETEEVAILAVGDAFYQRIRMVGPAHPPDYKWFQDGVPYIVGGSLVGVVFIYLVVRCCRDDPCPTCGAKLVWSRDQCAACRFYKVEMPDPILLARLRARSMPLRGHGFASHALHSIRPSDRASSRAGRCARRLATALCLKGHFACQFALRVSKLLAACLVHLAAKLLRRPTGCTSIVPVDDGALVDSKKTLAYKKNRAASALYLVDPQLRRENIFGPLERVISPHERAVVVCHHFGGLGDHRPGGPKPPDDATSHAREARDDDDAEIDEPLDDDDDDHDHSPSESGDNIDDGV